MTPTEQRESDELDRVAQQMVDTLRTAGPFAAGRAYADWLRWIDDPTLVRELNRRIEALEAETRP
jgi:fructose 1,6-bisphosphatase